MKMKSFLGAADEVRRWELAHILCFDIRRCVACPDALDDLGLRTRWNATVLSELAEKPDLDGRIQEFDDRAEIMHRLSTILLRKRICRLLPVLYGWPRRFVLILDPSKSQAILTEFRRDYDNFEVAKTIGEEWSDNIVSRITSFSTHSAAVRLDFEKE